MRTKYLTSLFRCLQYLQKERKCQKIKSENRVAKTGQSVPIATYLLISINILVFLILNIVPNSRDVLLLDPELLGQIPWTLVTVMFSHELAIHVILNMIVVFLFGRELEQIAGSRIVLLAYCLPGVLGSLTIAPYASIIQWSGPVAGASAAAFGVVAALAAILPDKVVFKGKVKHWMLALFAGNLVFMVINPGISIGGPAHAVGIIAGYLLGMAVRKMGLRSTDQNGVYGG